MPDVTRIIEQTASETIYNDDWLVKDSVNQGTTKIQPSVLKAWINDGMATVEELETAVGNIADTYNTSESYVVDDLCIHEYALFKCIGATTGTWDSTKWQATTIAEIIATIDLSAEAISYDNTASGLEAENVQDAIDEVDTALETKAEKNGVYDDLVAGNLLSDSYTADNKPYLYRQSPSASSVDQNLIGASVAWNQLVQNGNFASTSGWSAQGTTFTVSGNTATITCVGADVAHQLFQMVNVSANHKYFVTADLKPSKTARLFTRLGNVASPSEQCAANIWTTVCGVKQISSSEISGGGQCEFNLYTRATDGLTDGDTYQVQNAYCIDLTQAFGSTIADAVYTMEQAEEGSGIAWLKSYGFLTKDYYAYQSGKLESVNVSSRKIVGFNQWDEEWEVGGLNPLNGETTSENDRIRSKNFRPCKPNMTMFYYIPSGKGNLQIVFYDINKNYLGYYNYSTEHTFATPNGCSFFKFNTSGSYGTTYNNDICINISDVSKNGTYEPYTKHTYPLDSDLTLRGIPKLDSNNNLYYDGDIYKSDGSVKRRYGVMDLGSLSWTHDGNSVFRSTALANSKLDGNSLCIKYTRVISSWDNVTDGKYRVGTNAIRICDTNYSDATAFKTAVNGVYLIYELATPTSETADTYENPQLVGSTEEFIDTRDVPIPVGGERKYYTDLKAKLEELAKIPDVPSTNGTYTLKATRSASGVTYSWVSG